MGFWKTKNILSLFRIFVLVFFWDSVRCGFGPLGFLCDVDASKRDEVQWRPAKRPQPPINHRDPSSIMWKFRWYSTPEPCLWRASPRRTFQPKTRNVTPKKYRLEKNRQTEQKILSWHASLDRVVRDFWFLSKILSRYTSNLQIHSLHPKKTSSSPIPTNGLIPIPSINDTRMQLGNITKPVSYLWNGLKWLDPVSKFHRSTEEPWVWRVRVDKNTSFGVKTSFPSTKNRVVDYGLLAKGWGPERPRVKYYQNNYNNNNNNNNNNIITGSSLVGSLLFTTGMS